MTARPGYTRNTSTAGGRGNWQGRASCRDYDAEIWFPVGVGAVADADTALAKSVCMGCPVRTDCLTQALTERVEFGVWGGMTEDERETVLRGTHPIADPALGAALRTARIGQTLRTDRIAALAAAGHTDTQIAQALGGDWTPKRVGEARRSADIPAGIYARSMQPGRVA